MDQSALKNISKKWTLFIDRDGVVNHEKYKDYIHNWDEFRFYDGAKEAFRIFNRKLGVIVMVTNQRGVARGMVRLEDLEEIHQNMLSDIEKTGGRIDRIYSCTEMESTSRKPGVGMGLQAIKDFREIDLSKSIMVGNTLSDMQFGRNLGLAINVFLSTTQKDMQFGRNLGLAINVFLSTTQKGLSADHPEIDLVFKDLLSFAQALEIS